MISSPGRRFTAVITCLATATALALAGCTSTSSTGGTAPSGIGTAEPRPSAPGSIAPLRAALALVPADETIVQFSDPAAAKQRWGLSAVNGATPRTDPQAQALAKKMASSSAASALDPYDQLLADSGWSGLDVDWSVSFGSSGPPVTIYRFRDGLAMSIVTDSFVKDGMTRSGTAERPRFTAKTIGAGTFGKIFLTGVTVVPEQHLLIAGPETTPPATGDDLGAAPAVQTLVADLATPDSATIAIGVTACQDPTVLAGTQLSAEQLKSFRARYHLDELQPITGAMAAVTDDQHGTVVTSYSDEAKANSDLPLRKDLLTEDSLATKSPYTDLFTGTATANGSDIRYQLTFKNSSAVLPQLVQRRDGPWAFC